MEILADNKDFDYKSKVAGINGWASDLEKSPGRPHQANEETILTDFHDPIAVKQQPKVEVLLTNERGSYPPVLSNLAPPKGLSGIIRRRAFKYSENTMRHWLMLMGADRIDMVEGWIEDIKEGKKPMILPRMEFRTLDHLRRISDQGMKNNQDRAIVAATALGVVGVGVIASMVVGRLLAGPNTVTNKMPG